MPPRCERRLGGRGCPVLGEPRPRGAAAVHALNPEAIPGEGYGSGTRAPAATAESFGVAWSPGISLGLLSKQERLLAGDSCPNRWDRRGLEARLQVAKSDCPVLPHEETEGRGELLLCK